MRRLSKNEGFTFVELLVVIAIIGIISMLLTQVSKMLTMRNALHSYSIASFSFRQNGRTVRKKSGGLCCEIGNLVRYLAQSRCVKQAATTILKSLSKSAQPLRVKTCEARHRDL
jgi:prepilin-type N-terminal cleavage/methylation domain-containing protein